MAQAANLHDEQSTAYAQNLTASPTQTKSNDAKHEPTPRDRDSGVFLSDTEDSLPFSTPSRTSSVSLKNIQPQRSDSTRAVRRLQRPAELNLGVPASPNASKPKSELELRYDLIRNSKTQSRAALKSPTQLLKDRLDLSPKKSKHDEVERVFIPPRPMLNGCMLPGPAAQIGAFTGKDVRARTEKGRVAWWCKFDKLVVFDGVCDNSSSSTNMKFRTRSSKGLSIARRRGDLETIVIPLDCAHCQKMLNRSEWKHDIQVCKRSVCWDCTERCRWEMVQEAMLVDSEDCEEAVSASISCEDGASAESQIEANRERVDSLVQNPLMQDEELMRKLGLEMGPKSPMEAVGGIEERLDEDVRAEGA